MTILVICFLFSGCSSVLSNLPPGKFRIGGSYDKNGKEYGGWIEYEINPKKSGENGIPTLVGKDETGKEKEAYIIPKEDVDKINAKLMSKGAGTNAKTAGKQDAPGIKGLMNTIK